jgi:signal transduction histidine kinase
MAGRNFSLRLVAPSVLTSVLLLGLCTFVAVSLYRQQTGTAEILGENIGSRRAASNLQESLSDLLALHREAIERVEPLHERAETLLAEIQHYVDKDEERLLADDLVVSFRRYQAAWQQLTGADRNRAATEILSSDTLPHCQALINYNTRQIEESEMVHGRTLRWMAWGLAAVGGAGSLAGLLLGYGVARSLSRSIHQLRVRVQDAADRLGQDLPPVVLSESDGLDLLQEQLHGLLRPIEQVVERLQQREHEVLRAEQMAAVGQLAAGVAHELRNPLTSIKLLVQTGRESAPEQRLSTDDLAVIETEVRRMERVLKTFLDFARPPRLERTTCDLVRRVEATLDLARGRAQRQNVTLRFTRAAVPIQVEADGEQLQQVLVNLVLNALDAMPHGGELLMRLWQDERGDVEVSVLDTGPGVAADVMPRLFQPFVSTKETGVGLGLVVSRRIVEDHGGTLQASNRPEGGACFLLRLPASTATAVSA